jgi:hypothetical protein
MRERAFFNAVGGERELLCRWLLEERETTRQWSERERVARTLALVE